MSFLLREHKRFLPPAFGEPRPHGHWGLELSLILDEAASVLKFCPSGISKK